MSRCPILFLLTDDLLSRIRSKITEEADKKSFRLTCKAFYRVDSLSRTRLRVLRPEFLPTLLAKFPSLEVLDLSLCPRVDHGMVVLMLSSVGWSRRLRTLVLRRANGLRYPGLEMLVRACSERLEAIDVSFCCGSGDREAQALSCAAGLRDLRLDKCLNVTDVGLAHIAVGCGRLERLSLKWCLEITDLGIDLLTKKCLQLKFLDISYLEVTSQSLRSISNLQMLENLAMVGCTLLDDAGLHFLGSGCPQLKELSSTLIQLLKESKNLNSLVVDGARVSESTFPTIGSGCKSLVELGLGKCSGLTDRDIRLLVTGCVNLRILNLTCCGSITDASISGIVDSCRKLVCLKLESCSLITEKSLYMLGSYSILLEDLDLTDCAGVNDTGERKRRVFSFMMMKFFRLSNLYFLPLESCNLLKFLHHLAALSYLSRCSELICLKLGLCASISDKGLFYIASNCGKIHELDLYR
ncbi:hypothetical protein Dimus_012077 [Dionaea muscipula]